MSSERLIVPKVFVLNWPCLTRILKRTEENLWDNQVRFQLSMVTLQILKTLRQLQVNRVLNMKYSLKTRCCDMAFGEEKLRSCPEKWDISEVAYNHELMGKCICIYSGPVPFSWAKQVNMLRLIIHIRRMDINYSCENQFLRDCDMWSFRAPVGMWCVINTDNELTVTSLIIGSKQWLLSHFSKENRF